MDAFFSSIALARGRCAENSTRFSVLLKSLSNHSKIFALKRKIGIVIWIAGRKFVLPPTLKTSDFANKARLLLRRVLAATAFAFMVI